jgi:hypothetical protein
VVIDCPEAGFWVCALLISRLFLKKKKKKKKEKKLKN